MNRTTWKFQYTAEELSKAAHTKFDFHTGRLEWWKKKKEEVMTKIKAEGLEIDESVALGYSNSGRSTSVQVRNDLLTDLNECVGKIREHTSKVADFDAWIQVLDAQKPTMSLDLYQDDWLFFFGKV